VIEGATYDFKIKALNRWGEAEFWSNPVSILAASEPYQVQTLITSVDDSDGGNLLIEWDAAWDRGAPVTSHVVQVKQKSNSWY
jgi:hypothetical protein